MPSASFLPRGTQFSRSADGGTTRVVIAEAKKIGFSVKGSFEDVTNMDTTSAYKEWLPGMIDGGSVTVELNFINTDTVQGELWADLAAQTLLTWRVQLPNTRGRFDFSGYVEGMDPDFDVEKAASNKLSVKISGALTWTASV
jgi:phosphoglucomutase